MGEMGIEYFNKQAEWNRILGDRMRQRRIERGISQTRLAELTDISSRTISHYENGRTCPFSHTLYRIARALSVDIGYFYGTIRADEHAKF